MYLGGGRLLAKGGEGKEMNEKSRRVVRPEKPSKSGFFYSTGLKKGDFFL